MIKNFKYKLEKCIYLINEQIDFQNKIKDKENLTNLNIISKDSLEKRDIYSKEALERLQNALEYIELYKDKSSLEFVLGSRDGLDVLLSELPKRISELKRIYNLYL